MAVPIFIITKVVLDQSDQSYAQLISIDIPDGNTSPEEFAGAVAVMPDLSGPTPILITGRAPIWGYGMILHRAHATPAVAVFDPRLGGYVVVQSHTIANSIGYLIVIP